MKDTFYFSHDYNARKDPKLIKLFIEEKMQGIGIYWCIIEMLYEQGGHLELNKLDIYAYELRIDTEILEKIVKNYDLFILKKNKFFSKSVLKRLGERQKRSDIARVKAEKRWNKKTDAVALLLHKSSNAENENSNAIKESKGKEKKVVVQELQQKIYSFFKNNNQDTFEVEKFLEYNKDKKLTSDNWEGLAKRWIKNIKGNNSHEFISEFEQLINKQISDLTTAEEYAQYKSLLFKQENYKKLNKQEKLRIEQRLSDAWSFRISLNENK